MSQDIGDFLKEEIRGPAGFSCVTGSGWKFEEPAMNDLTDSVFRDKYITLECDGGGCLHYSQVPGYVVKSPQLGKLLPVKIASSFLEAT